MSWPELATVEPLLKAQAAVLFPVAEAVTGTRVSPESVLFSPLTQPILFWGLSGAPVVLPVIFFNRFVRGTVGPLFINLALLTALTTLVFNDLWLNTSDRHPAARSASRQVFGDYTFAALTVSEPHARERHRGSRSAVDCSSLSSKRIE